MTFAIRIKENADAKTWRFEKTFDSPAEFRRLEKLCVSKPIVNSPYFVAARTDTWSHFCEDFFLPSTLHTTLKMKTLAEQIFTVIGHLLLDMVTLPVRLLTLIPQYLGNKKQDHPLHKYLVQEKADPRILNTNQVYLQKVSLGRNQGMEILEENLRYVELPDYATSQCRSEFFQRGKKVPGIYIPS